MAYEERPRSLVDEQPEIVVHIPEAGERSQAPPTVVEDRRVPWIERKEAPWIIVAAVVAVVAVVALLVLLQDSTIEVSATPDGGGGTSTVEQDAPPWAALSLPVPESYRTHTANVKGSLDVIEVANLGPGVADVLVGSVTTVDGPTVQQIFSDQAFSIVSPSGAALVAYLPYDAGDAPIGDPGQEVTFVGTLMPVPDDFAAMVGTEAASTAALTGVYVRVIPETLSIVTTVPEPS
jgi:hypothetical protein